LTSPPDKVIHCSDRVPQDVGNASERTTMAGRLRRLLETVPRGRVDLGEVAALAARPPGPSALTLTPSAALARELLATRLASTDPARCRVLGPGRLVSAATLPFACRMDALDADGVAASADAELDWLVVGDALAAEDDPPATLARVARRLPDPAAPRLLVVLPGTALLPDDAAACPRRWLFGRVSGERMAATALAGRTASVTSRGNVLAACMDVLGLPADRLWPKELAADDPEYPMVVVIATGARV
jgi:hypothetical protein